MLTNTDIQKLKEVFATKDDIRGLKEDMNASFKILSDEIKTVVSVVIDIGRDVLEIKENHEGRLDHLENKISN